LVEKKVTQRLEIIVYAEKMTCRGICSKYKATKKVGETRYQLGQKRSSACEIFMKLVVRVAE